RVRRQLRNVSSRHLHAPARRSRRHDQGRTGRPRPTTAGQGGLRDPPRPTDRRDASRRLAVSRRRKRRRSERDRLAASGAAGGEARMVGPNYTTAMAVLALTVEYRFLPIYQRGEEPESEGKAPP